MMNWIHRSRSVSRLWALLLSLVGLALATGCGVPGREMGHPQGLTGGAKGGIAVKGGHLPSITPRATKLKDELYQIKSPKPSVVDPNQIASINGLIAHEWGTFTSVQSAKGSVLEGLHHEEEPLPSFVFKRARGYWGKGMEVLSQVTQKLETPVIYFYTNKAQKVKVEVAFPKGVISEWFPNATAFSPPVASHNSRDGLFVPQNGKMTWEVELLPGLKQAPPTVAPDDIWAPSRDVPDATPLRFVEQGASPSNTSAKAKTFLKTQVEKFIFYRGVGKFDGWFRTQAPDDKTLVLHNLSSSVVPQVYLLRVQDGKGTVVTLPAMKAGERRKVQIPVATASLGTYVQSAASQVAKGLIASGLYPKEAWAMVNTWKRSYFSSQTPGVRVLYIVPRADTDTLLPISIKPQPSQLVRTLVGRIEVLTPSVEADTIKLLKQARENNQSPNIDLFGRFGEPRLRLACQQIQEADFKAYCQRLTEKLINAQRYSFDTGPIR